MSALCARVVAFWRENPAKLLLRSLGEAKERDGGKEVLSEERGRSAD